MWVLKKLGDVDKTFYIISRKGSYSVGRKAGDIILEGDTSISRHHCTIKIAKKDDCPFGVDTPTGIWVIDEGSKYGTFINEKDWVKINPNVVQKLQNNSVVRFGVLENLYRVEYKPIKACTSMMTDDQKENIRKALSLIDGRLLNDFDKNCSLLIVNKVTLTPKVVLALIYGVPIVTPPYIKKLAECIVKQMPKPDFNDFKPEIGELSLTASLVSLDPKNHRRELFKGKIFMVPSKKQYDNLRDIIVAAGGKIELLRDCNWDQLGGDNIIILKPQSGATIDVNAYKKNLASYKTKFGKRVIPENEIPQAIAYSSIEQFCNPKCLNFGVRRESGEMSRGEIIEGETQNFLSDMSEGTGVVPNSSQSQSDVSQSQSKLGNARKRDHSPEDSNTSSAKKRAVEETNSSTQDNTQFRVPAAKKQTSLLSFISSKDKTIEKPASLNSPVSQSILKSNDNVLEDYREMPKKPAKRKAYFEEERPAPTRIEPTVKKSRVSTDMFMEEPSTSKKDTPARKNFPAQNNKQPELIARKDSTSTSNSNSSSSSYGRTTIEDDDDDDEKWISCNRKIEPKEDSDDLNTTVVLLSLVSVSFTKDNGSVVEPPHGLKNVKRFRKQRLLVPTTRIVPIDIEDDDDDWTGCFSKPSQIS